jgi:hypothetical protein
MREGCAYQYRFLPFQASAYVPRDVARCADHILLVREVNRCLRAFVERAELVASVVFTGTILNAWNAATC